MSDLGPLGVSALVAALLAPGMHGALRRAGGTRENYRGRQVAFPAGAVAIVASIVALGLMSVLDEVAGTSLLSTEVLVFFGEEIRYDPSQDPWLGNAAAVLALGVALLGLADDLLPGAGRGWRGHAAALRRGELSTGAFKAIGTVALATAVLAGDEAWLVSVLLVALTTNLFNLLDLRPGRAVKAFVLVGAGLVIAGHVEPLHDLGAWIGPLLVVGLFDLRERAMLGDTGSNVLGALAGLWLVAVLGPAGEAVALGVVLAITVYGELRSITATIERVAPLRWLDELGRPPQDAA